jgi:hypothetical protein
MKIMEVLVIRTGWGGTNFLPTQKHLKYTFFHKYLCL